MAKKTILVVEDEEDMQYIYQDLLAKKYHLIVVNNAEHAALKLKQEKIDLMLLDIILPDKTGDEFFKEIKQKKKFKKLPVIIISVLGDMMDELKRTDPDVVCMQKPFDDKVLLGKIDELLK
ncbi:MAG: response regulator [Nanoarchaeota archaeon]|nr:response regulator [Nanoarchaeota archaeon]